MDRIDAMQAFVAVADLQGFAPAARKLGFLGVAVEEDEAEDLINLVVNGELERHGIEGFRFFSFTPFGLPILILGIIYMSFARRWLAATKEVNASSRPSLADWIEEYGLADREYRVRVTAQSPLAGKTLAELNLRKGDQIEVTGWKTEFEGVQTIFAREVRHGQEVFVFRDKSGVPVW